MLANVQWMQRGAHNHRMSEMEQWHQPKNIPYEPLQLYPLEMCQPFILHVCINFEYCLQIIVILIDLKTHFDQDI